MGAVVAAQIIKEEGLSRDGNTTAGGESGQGEFGAGESGGGGDYGEHGEPVLEVCDTRLCASCPAAGHDVKTVGRSTMGARSCRRRRLWEVKVERWDCRRRRQERGVSR